MTELKKSPPDPCMTDPIEKKSCVEILISFFEVSDSTIMTESEFCPPDPWMTDSIEKNSCVEFLISFLEVSAY